jgi:vacuolar iron transporter family protein
MWIATESTKAHSNTDRSRRPTRTRQSISLHRLKARNVTAGDASAAVRRTADYLLAELREVNSMAESRRRRRSITRIGHREEHFTASDAVRDVVIGMSDGLTVPFALAAGITGAIAASHVVVTAGIAELAAGGISMGLGGYLAARSDIEHYESERKREIAETEQIPDEERREIEVVFASYGLTGEALEQVTHAVTSDPHRWVDFMMRFELGLERPDPKSAPTSAARIGGSYVVGGIVPLLPYVFIPDSHRALLFSIAFTAVALFAFGGIKGRFTGVSWLRSAFQAAFIGGVAAAVAFFLARLVT